ncbi:MAG: PaaI family thioesterase [Solirubrobacteraceae bacterium]|jgi:uncharacterized protein (TIGR00369 family)
MMVPDLDNLAAVGFDALYGLEVTDASPERITARVPVRDELKQPFGLVHGGVYAAIAEGLASFGTALAVMTDGKVVMGISNHTSFLRPITEGVIHAHAVPRHAGRTTWVWEIEIRDQAQRPCALSRVTIAVRDARVPEA